MHRTDGLNPRGDWFAILIATLVITCLFVGVGVYRYVAARRVVGGGEVVRATPALDMQSRLDAVLTRYRIRVREFDALRTQLPESTPQPFSAQTQTETDGEGAAPPTEQGTTTAAE